MLPIERYLYFGVIGVLLVTSGFFGVQSCSRNKKLTKIKQELKVCHSNVSTLETANEQYVETQKKLKKDCKAGLEILNKRDDNRDEAEDMEKKIDRVIDSSPPRTHSSPETDEKDNKDSLPENYKTCPDTKKYIPILRKLYSVE